MKKVIALALSVALVSAALWVVRWVVPRYNEIVALHEDARKEWAQTETLLERRYDLIPKLVAVTERFATGQEKEILAQVTDAYAGYRAAKDVNGKIDAAHRTEGCLSKIVAFGGLYPQLSSTTHFTSLLVSLERTEDRIADGRMKFNQAVSRLNTTLRTVEGSVANRFAGVPAYRYYEPPAITKVPQTLEFKGKDPKASTLEVKAVGPLPEPEPTRQGKGARIEDLKLKGVLNLRGRDRKAVTAVLGLPDGTSRVVKLGDKIVEFGAEVAEISAEHVTFDVAGGSQVRIARD